MPIRLERYRSLCLDRCSFLPLLRTCLSSLCPSILVAERPFEIETEEVEFEADPEGEVVEIESEPVLQSIFYPWAKVNWMYHPEE